MPEKVQSPEKELRFTRSGQAVAFWISSAVMVAAAVTILASSIYRDEVPQLPHPLWALLPMGFAWLAARIAVHMTKHAYLIFTPLGIEIFPWFRPERSMRLVLWQEIQLAETDDALTRLTLHHDAGKTSGIHVSLAPIRKDRRVLLAKAIAGRLSRA
jgi:hypothetical protein